MSSEYTITPVDKLTNDIIDSLVIHQTVSSLRRAGDISPCIIKVDGTSDIPTLYYIKGASTSSTDWTINALSSDIERYLLRYTLGNPVVTTTTTQSPGETFTSSTISWDTDKTGGSGLTVSVENNVITFSGSIAYYTDSSVCNTNSGNKVGVMITPADGMLDKYPNVKVYLNGVLYNNLVFKEVLGVGYILYYYPIITKVGISIPITLQWDSNHIENFKIIISNDSTLDSTSK